MSLTAPQRKALEYLATVPHAAPSAIGEAMGGTRSNRAQGLGRLGAAMGARLIKMGLAYNSSSSRGGFPAYSISFEGRQKLKEMVNKMSEQPLWLHKKRGTFYAEIARAEVQASAPIKEGDTLVVYLGQDGKAWCRPVAEFEDGRFELLETKPLDFDDRKERK